MMKSNSSNRIKPADLRMDGDQHPGWVSGATRRPTGGDEVLCTGGAGTVVAVRGKTGDGTPLVQIQLSDEDSPAFYAAASNVLLAP
ncbi:MAG TPA: hypothetical protein VFS20_16245 [Longimicrobium sp.]|nr:hypothetical protein [Longimicrobium sp.]